MKQTITRKMGGVAGVLIVLWFITLVVVSAEGAGEGVVDVGKYDFETAMIESVPAGWSIVNTDIGESGDWKVVEDKTSPGGAKVLAQTAASPSAMFNLCVADNTNFNDVTVSVAFKAVKGRTDQGGGVVWRYQDAGNYYIARYNPLEENFRLYKVVNGERRQLATKEALKAPSGEWHALTIRMEGEEITCLLNGQKELEARDDTFGKAGKVGLWTKADAQTYFDDFQAEALTK